MSMPKRTAACCAYAGACASLVALLTVAPAVLQSTAPQQHTTVTVLPSHSAAARWLPAPRVAHRAATHVAAVAAAHWLLFNAAFADRASGILAWRSSRAEG